MQVAFVGVGAMGRDMAGHVARAGHPLIAADVSAEARELAAADGLKVADTLDVVAKEAEIFIVVVATDDQSRSVTESVLKAGKPGSVIVIAATNSPNTMRELAGQAAEKGFGFVDAPIVFGREGAKDGTLVSLCGGSDADLERVRPVLMAYSRAVHHVGPVGAGQLAKTCNNMMHWAACVASYETLLLAKACGIDAHLMRETLLKCPARNTTLERWDSTRFTWHEKDMDVVLELAQAGAVPLPLFGQVDQLVKRLGPDDVKALLYGPEAEYLGKRIVPLDRGHGGFGEQ